jgi:hypothetical protein
MKPFALLPVVVLMASCATTTPPPEPYNPTLGAQAQVDSFIGAKAQKYNKKVDRVAITACNVLFAKETSASASTGAGIFDTSKRAESRVSIVYTMAGLTVEDKQHMTDMICSKAEQRLQKSGYHLVSFDEMKKHDRFVSLQEAGKPSPYDFKVGSATYEVFSRSGSSIFDERYIGTTSGLGQAFSAMGGNAAWQHEAVALEQGEVSGININILVDFAAVSSSGNGGGLASKNTAEVSGQVGLSVSGELRIKPFEELNCWSRFGKRECEVRANKQPTYSTLRPVNIGDKFYEKVENVTTAGDKVAAGVTKALSFIGGGTSQDVTRYQVTVKRDTFEVAADKAVDGFIDMAVQKAKSEK